MDSYLADVSDIVDDLGASIVFDDDIPIDDIELADTAFRVVSPAHVSGTLTNAGDGIVVTGSVSAPFRTDCARCLISFTLDIDADLEGLFTTPELATELPEEQEWEPLPSSGLIDLAPSIDAAIRLELPIAPLHTPECKGICPTCGANLNDAPCDCHEQQATSGPFDVLKSLLPDTDEEIPNPE